MVGVDDAHLLDEQSALVVHQIVRRHLATVCSPCAPANGTGCDHRPVEGRAAAAAGGATAVQGGDRGAARSRAGRTSSNRRPRTRYGITPAATSLYLRQLVADELGAGRLFQRSEVWVWDAQLEVSATLAELIDATIGQQSPPVHEVLDVLAVADPVELGVLGEIAGASAIDDAETHGLITVDTLANPPMARLAHPMFGEVRRIRAGTMRLRQLRSTVAAKLPPLDDPPDPVSVVRRAVLIADSDTPPCPELLVEGAAAALRLTDATTAERLARKAVDAGGGEKAKLLQGLALVSCDRLHEALAVNASLIDAAPTEHARVLYTAARATILSSNWEIDRAEAELASVRETAIALGLMRPYSCVAALLQSIRGRAEAAVEAATRGLTAPGWIDDFFELVGVMGMVAGLRELGRVEELQQAVERGYRLSRASPHSPTMRYPLGVLHLDALRLSGLLRAQRQAADTLADEPMDDAFARTHRALFEGMTAMALGDLAAARNWLRETLATGAARETTWIGNLARLWLATVMSMSGDHDGARTILAVPDPSHRPFLIELALASSWVRACEGATSEAAAIVLRSAASAQAAGRPAQEVLCLQTAAQYGDPSGASRLMELTTVVDGPRVTTAAEHAQALRDEDGDLLREVSRLYEAFGDRVAAADAAAQAAIVYRDQGRRGAAMTASAVARRLADETGADTPALRANTTPVPVTARQREIITLAATGLSNREIADRLTMSVRTVEGHLFRASQKTGTNSREELIALVEGR